MPVTNAAEPEAPGGGQSSHAGAALDPAAPEAAGPELAALGPEVPAREEPALAPPAAETAVPDPDWAVVVLAAVCAAAGAAQIAKSSRTIGAAADRIGAAQLAGADRGAAAV